MKTLSFVAGLIIISVIATACSADDLSVIPDKVVMASGTVLQSGSSRAATTDVSASDKVKLVKDNGVFSFELFHELKDDPGNIICSPHSISTAMAMVYAGAAGNTEQQIADTLRYNLPQERLHPAFNWLDSELNRRGEGAEGKDGEAFRLNIVNALWGQKNYEFRQSFLDILAQNYGAGLRIVDYEGETEKSRVTINDWVSEQTENRIHDLVPPGAITPDTRLVLTNAVYLNAAWYYPFSEYPEDFFFTLPDGGKTAVPAMSIQETFHYSEGSDYQAVELLYDGRELSMVIILPAEGQYESFENKLNYDKATGIIDTLVEREVIIRMPEFEFASQFKLTNLLSSMGMPDAFSKKDADFSGINEHEQLLIDEILHRAFIVVDTDGTEAAATTGISVIPVSADFDYQPPVEMIIDRPFIFFIRDIETGTVIFVGRVVNPLEYPKFDLYSCKLSVTKEVIS
ncbi:MAG: serpin family protein [Dehalococcoidales bacterium]|nr:serpin family protein [Dehalococcoidales bacterium]